jgi:hypothetical protein
LAAIAAEQMRYAGNVDPETVRRIRRHHRRVADGPARQFPQRSLVLLRRGLNHMQIGNEGLCLCKRHPDMQTKLLCRHAGCAEDAA